MKLPATGVGREEVCTPESCSPKCALEIIDALLRDSKGFRGEEIDQLLDLRWLLYHRENAEAALTVFCRLRRCLEESHYLAFYRLRRWLENQIEACVRLRRGEPEHIRRFKLERYCLEAIRSQCLCSVHAPEETLWFPRVRFRFCCLAGRVHAG